MTWDENAAPVGPSPPQNASDMAPHNVGLADHPDNGFPWGDHPDPRSQGPPRPAHHLGIPESKRRFRVHHLRRLGSTLSEI